MSEEAQKKDGEGDTPEGESALNLNDGRDIALVRRAVRERWPIPAEKRKKIADKLMQIASGDNKEADARAVTSASRTLARMDALNQADEHLADKNGRLADGLPTERVETNPVEIRIVGMTNNSSDAPHD